MNIQIEKNGDVVIIRPAGRIDSANAGQFEQTLKTEFAQGTHRLILDFSQLDYVSSAGLRCVLLAGKHARGQAGGKLVLAGLRDPIREIFEISGFLSIFTVTPDLDQALTHFA